MEACFRIVIAALLCQLYYFTLFISFMTIYAFRLVEMKFGWSSVAFET